MATVSVVVTTYNRAKSLTRCLTSVRWAEELIVVDSSSTDDTKTVAKRFTDKIFTRPNHPMLNVNKNFGFTKATGDWILCIDDDEEVPEELAREIHERTQNSGLRTQNEIIGFWIPRKNIIFGKWIRHSIWWPDPQLRLFRRGKGRFPEKHVHEYLQVEGKNGRFEAALIHYNYDTIDQYLSKMSAIYTDSEVGKLVAYGYRVSWVDALRFPISDFLKTYFAQAGYKDGLHGLVLSLLQAFYALVVFAKLWEKERFSEREMPLSDVVQELSRVGCEMRYWTLTGQIKEERNLWRLIWLKFLRKYYGGRTKV